MPSVSHTTLREQVARTMHDAYERAALEHGWETQLRSRVAWEDLPEANRLTTLASADAVLVVFAERERVLRERIEDVPVETVLPSGQTVWRDANDYAADVLTVLDNKEEA